MKRDFQAPGRSAVYSSHGMAATSMPIATFAALEVLQKGGNAMDAAIAAVATLCVVEPQSTGIGGDCFCLYAPAGTGKVIALNGSGRAPAGATPEALRARQVSSIVNTSAHAVTVPGAISAWAKLNATYGRKPLGELFQRAIKCAEEGFAITPRVAVDWADAAGKLRLNEASTRRFLPGGEAPRVGERFAFPELGKRLREIGEKGPSAFYEGEAAADMVGALQAAGGLHTEEDFYNGMTAAEFVDPISIEWRGKRVYQCPPNGSGLHVLMLLGILEGFETPSQGPMSAERYHRHIEAARLVYRDRDAFLADPAYMQKSVAELTSKEYLGKLRGLISDDHAMKTLPPAGTAEWAKHKDTVYLCVVDSEGNACSFINSLFESFGSGILAEKAGVMLQNRGFGFRLQEGHVNCIGPNKRPLHTIIPGMVMEGDQCLMPYGVMGGHFQPMGQTLFLTNHFEFGLDVQEAIDCPRLYPHPFTGIVELERGIPASVVDRLQRLGHNVKVVEKPHGGGQAILMDRKHGFRVAGSDPRKDGLALGY